LKIALNSFGHSLGNILAVLPLATEMTIGFRRSWGNKSCQFLGNLTQLNRESFYSHFIIYFLTIKKYLKVKNPKNI